MTAPASRAFTMESHQKYMKEHVNPMLESLVTALLIKKPVDPIPYMMGWFAEQVPGKSPGENDPSLEELRSQVEAVKEQCRKLEEKVVDKVRKNSKGKIDDEE